MARKVYERADDIIKKINKIIYIFLIYITLIGAMVLNLITTMYAYFTIGLSDYDPNFTFIIW